MRAFRPATNTSTGISRLTAVGATTSEKEAGPSPVPQSVTTCPGRAVLVSELMGWSAAETKFWMLAGPNPPPLAEKRPIEFSTTNILEGFPC